ncbi:hypothetical protein SDJN02_16768, partial [Cucurbita argyrosperma subsp. argyrosperma]
MSRDECVKALARHANIRPLITLTVWKELQKENTEFFRAYLRTVPPKPFLDPILRDLKFAPIYSQIQEECSYNNEEKTTSVEMRDNMQSVIW